MLIRKNVIDVKERFIPRKRRVYLLSREKREEMHKFIDKQLRKGYIRLLKLFQIALVFLVGKKNSRKYMVQNYR